MNLHNTSTISHLETLVTVVEFRKGVILSNLNCIGNDQQTHYVTTTLPTGCILVW